MKKIEFESEEQFQDFIKITLDRISSLRYSQMYLDELFTLYKEKGYIKKSYLEIAKEKYLDSGVTTTYIDSYITGLEKEIKRLKKLL